MRIFPAKILLLVTVWNLGLQRVKTLLQGIWNENVSLTDMTWMRFVWHLVFSSGEFSASGFRFSQGAHEKIRDMQYTVLLSGKYV